MFQGAIRDDDDVRNPQNFVDVITLIYVDMFVACLWVPHKWLQKRLVIYP